MFNTLRSHSALGGSSKSGGLAVECQKTRLVQVPLIRPLPIWLGSLQTGVLARNGIVGSQALGGDPEVIQVGFERSVPFKSAWRKFGFVKVLCVLISPNAVS